MGARVAARDGGAIGRLRLRPAIWLPRQQVAEVVLTEGVQRRVARGLDRLAKRLLRLVFATLLAGEDVAEVQPPPAVADVDRSAVGALGVALATLATVEELAELEPRQGVAGCDRVAYDSLGVGVAAFGHRSCIRHANIVAQARRSRRRFSRRDSSPPRSRANGSGALRDV